MSDKRSVQCHVSNRDKVSAWPSIRKVAVAGRSQEERCVKVDQWIKRIKGNGAGFKPKVRPPDGAEIDYVIKSSAVVFGAMGPVAEIVTTLYKKR